MRRALLLSAIFVPVLAFAQDDDRGYLQALLEDNLSSAGRQVRIVGFEGALSSQARLQELTIADDTGVWLTLRDVTLDWTRSALLAGRVEINALTAREILLPRAPETAPSAPSAEASAFALPELPVSVSIDELRADRVVIGAPLLGQEVVASVAGAADLADGEGNASLRVERIEGPDGRFALDGSYSNESRLLSLALEASEPAQGIVATLAGIPGAPAMDLTIRGDGPIDDFTAQIRLASDGQDRLAGQVSVLAAVPEGAAEATPPERRFSVDLGGDIAPLFLPEYRDFFGPEIRLAATGKRAASGTITLSDLSVSAADLTLTGQARIGADGVPQLLALDGQLGGSGTPVLLPLPGPQTRVTAASVTVDFDAAQDDGWTAEAQVTGLDRPDLDIAALRLSGSGRIAPPDAGRGAAFGGTIRFGATGIAPTDPALVTAIGPTVEGSFKTAWRQGAPLRLSNLAVSGAGLQLAGNLRIDGFDGGLPVAGRIEAEVADLSRFAALAGRPLQGQGTVTAEGEVVPLGGAFDAVVTVQGQGLGIGMAEVDRLLAGPSRVDLSARRSPEGTQIRSFTATAATLAAEASGWIRSAGSDLSARVGMTDLSVLGVGYGGALAAETRYVDTDGTGEITATAKATDLRTGIPQADGLLRGETRLTLAGTRTAEGLTVEDLTVDGQVLRAKASGALLDDARRVAADVSVSDLSGVGPGYRGRITARGSYDETGDTATITADATGQDLALGIAEVDRLLRGRTQLSLSANRAGERLRVDRFTLDNPQLTAEAQGLQDNGTRRVDLTARLANLGLFAPEIPGPVTLSGRVTETGAGYEVNLGAKGPGGIDATVTGSLSAGFDRADLAIRGGAQAVLANAFIAPVSLSGPVRADLRLNGPAELSSLSGTVSLPSTRVTAPTLGLALRDTSATATLSGGRAQVDMTGTVESGGTLRVTGPVGLSAPFPADLSIALTRVILKDPELYTTRLGGVLTVQGNLANGARIGGQIDLVETELRVPSTGLGGSGDLPGLKHVNEPAPVRATRARAGLLDTGGSAFGGGDGPSYPLDVTILAPNRLFIRGRGLDAEMGGTLRLSGTTDAVIPSGGFDLIRGRLDLLGDRFTLDEGQLRLQGDFIPFVRLAATTTTDTVAVTIRVEGPADAPEITFTSSPELPQEEVLSQLLFGRDLTNISPLQAAQLASAIATLTGRGGEGLIGRLRQGVGLDNLDIQSAADGSSSLTAGKYLSRNLYTEVEVDSDGESQINLNLDVSKSITIRGRAGSDGTTGIGIYLEKDY